MTAFLIIFLIGSQVENYLLSTGAFEVYLNGKPAVVCVYPCTEHVPNAPPLIEQQVWSKLTSGRLPSLGEMKGLIDDLQSPGMVMESPT